MRLAATGYAVTAVENAELAQLPLLIAAPDDYRPAVGFYGRHDAVQSDTQSLSLAAGADSDRAADGKYDSKIRMTDMLGGFNQRAQHFIFSQKNEVCARIYRTRIKYTAAQKIEIWGCWQRGESLHSIARQFDRHHTSVRGILAATGGI
jgi:hypothetical protein